MRRACLIALMAVVAASSCANGDRQPQPADADGDPDAGQPPSFDGGDDIDDDGGDIDDSGDNDRSEAAAACVDATCSGHGWCVDGAGGLTCVCDEGHAGDDCGRCASGYQDNDDDGSCWPSCATAALACGPHGSCDDSGGVARCACASGWQDNDDDGLCMPECATAGLECEQRRHCDDSSGEAACVCDRGWAGETCEACAPGFVRSPEGDLCEPDHEWAVLVYMAADNELEPYALEDVEEIVDAGSSDSVHLVVLLDSFLDEAQAWYVAPGELVAISEPGELDTGDFRTLRDFGAWAVTTYPARHTALVLWDHGGGWKSRARAFGTLGFAFDEHGSAEGISISQGELGRALDGIVAALGGQRLDIVGFDACRMGMWEVAVATAPYADVLVASSEDEPLDGWSYLAPLRALRADPETDPFDLAAALVAAYGAESPLHSTLAATDLGALDAVTEAVNGLASALLEHPETFGEVEAARSAAQGFGDPASRDLWDVASRIAAIEGAPGDVVDAADLVVLELADALVASQSQPSHPGAHGLSIYLPGHGAGMDPDYADPAAPWSSTRWVELLAAFAAE